MNFSATATGGNSGNGNQGCQVSGTGGAASATASGASTGGAVTIGATAVGGAGTMSTDLLGSALARASATGASGKGSASATTGGGNLSRSRPRRSAPAGGNAASIAEARVSVSGTLPRHSLANGLQAAGYGTGTLSAADQQTLLAGHAPARSALLLPSNQLLGALNLETQSRTDTCRVRANLRDDGLLQHCVPILPRRARPRAQSAGCPGDRRSRLPDSRL